MSTTAIPLGRPPGPRFHSLAIRRSSTAPRRSKGEALPWGHVFTNQLKREVEDGIEFFWRKLHRAHLRPVGSSYMDFRSA